MNNQKMEPASQILCKNIKAFRINRGWAQRDIAILMGISTPAFSKIETGHTDLNFSRIEQIACIFGISTVQLLMQEDEQLLPPPSQFNILQKELAESEVVVAKLQAKIIELFGELQERGFFNRKK